MKTEENEHVEIHEVSGFVSDDLLGAMQEAYALSLGTRSKQYLFSVSLNPPVGAVMLPSRSKAQCFPSPD